MIQFARMIGAVPQAYHKCAVIVEDLAAVIEAFGPPQPSAGELFWSFVSGDGGITFSVWTKFAVGAEDVELVLFTDASVGPEIGDVLTEWFGETVQDTVCGKRAPAFIVAHGHSPQFVISDDWARRAA